MNPKDKMIMDLAKIRIKQSGIFEEHEENILIQEINNMSEDELHGLPESSIVDIVDTYLKLKSNGLSDIDSFNEIEDIRSIVAGRGKLPEPITLRNYIKYRFQHELDWALKNGMIGLHAMASYNNEFIEEGITKVLSLFQGSKFILISDIEGNC